MTIAHREHKFHNHLSRSLLPLETLAAAAKAVQAQSQDNRYRATVVSCELAFEADRVALQIRLRYPNRRSVT